MAASGSASSSSNIEAVRIRRRVPPEKRRRTAISCDLCKARRTKCIRPPPPPEASTSEVDPSQLEPCESCVANGRECVSLAPRKQRRYNQPALLEALVKAAFPDHDINDAETVSRLAQQMGVGVHAREVDSSGEGEEEVDRLRGKASEPVENSHSVLPAETIGASTSPQRSQCRPERSASPQLAPSHYEQDTLDVPAPSQPASAPPETTVPLQLQRDPLGRSQYIGPSGTLVFVSQIRELCRKAGVDVNSAFVRDNFVQALDAPQEGSTGAGPSAAEASGNPARLSTDDLPSRATADALVSAFFRFVHGNFVVFHRASFLGQYEALWDASPGAKSIDAAWAACTNMVFALGAEHLSGISDHSRQPGALSMQDLVRIRDKFFARAQALLPRVLSGSSLSNIQALLLIALYLHQTNERGATWNLIGSAIRMAFALGLHRRGAGRGARVGLLERELRKQVWWTLYMFERFLCSTLGRPSAINDDDVDVNRPSKGLLDVSEHTPLGHLEQSVSLWRIVGRICKSVYDPIKRPTSEHATTEAFLSELNAWYDALPPHLALVSPQPPSHRRAVVCLHVEYHQAICLLTRPLLLLKVAGKPPRADEHHDALARCNLPNTCVASARTCVELLSQLAADDIFNARTWMDVYYAYTSAMILSLPLLWGNRQWSQPERGVIPSATIEEDDMRYGVGQCLALLSELRMSGTMARFAEVVRNLSKAIGLSSRGPLVDANGSRRDGDSTRRNSYRDPALANLELLSQMSVNPTAASGDVSAHFLQPHGTNLTDGLSSELFFGPPFPLLSTAPNSNSPEELPTGPAVGNVTLGSDGTDPLSFPELMVNWTCDEIGSLLLHELDPAAFLWPGA